MRQMKLSHRTTGNQYDALRVNARSIAANSLPLVMLNSEGQVINVRGDVQLTGIDFNARTKARLWNSSPLRQVDWPWLESVGPYAWSNPKRFEVAVWYRTLFLSGMALGRPTWSGNKLRLDFIEASRERHTLTGLIVDIILIAAEAYADVIGASQIRIMNPINERVRSHYLSPHRGFLFNARENYCYRDL